MFDYSNLASSLYGWMDSSIQLQVPSEYRRPFEWKAATEFVILLICFLITIPMSSLLVYRRRKQKITGVRNGEKQIGKIMASFAWPIPYRFSFLLPVRISYHISCFVAEPPPTCVVSVLQTQPVVHGRVFIPDSPQCGNNEKANLLSEWPKCEA